MVSIEDIAPGAPLIRIDGVSRRFRLRNGQQTALSGIDLEMRRGEIFGVIGASGSGKSTLIRLINRLERPNEGRVAIAGTDLASLKPAALSTLRHKLGMIFQQFGLLASKTALQNVAFALDLAGVGTPHERLKRARDLLDRVGLTDHADKYPAQLSGGQKQRVAIARALANEPGILLCDEATSALDPHATQEVLTLLGDLNRELGLTIVLVTHEMEVVRQVCDRIAVLDHGRLVEIGTVADVLLEPKSPEGAALAAQLLPPPKDVSSDALVRLTWFGEDRLHSILERLDARLIQHAAQISRLKSGPYGDVWATLGGSQRAEAIERLRQAGVKVTEAQI